MKNLRALLLLAACAAGLVSTTLHSAVSVSPLFDHGMVIQRGQPARVWGSAGPGEPVTVRLAGHEARAVAGADGRWAAELPALEAGGPHTLRIEGSDTLEFGDVLVGEVWLASGQSNMGWTVRQSLNADLEALTARRGAPIRVLRVRGPGSQQPQDGFEGTWTAAAPDTVAVFSAVAYAFAQTLHDTLGVPVGIIENAWGGSAAEAWVPRPVIAAHPELKSIHEQWLETEAGYDFAVEQAAYEEQLRQWRERPERRDGRPRPEPRRPQDRMTGQHRPGNLWNARVLPLVPYPVAGVIWYQGESNAGRAGQYHELFSLMIREWRAAWGAELPFYWAQLADFREEKPFDPDSSWALLREAQTDTMALPRTGQAVIIDLGEARDIHPRHKEEVGRRLARWALNRDHGYADLVCRSPELAGWEQDGARLVVKFDYTGSGLRAFDTEEVRGFAVRPQEGAWILVSGKVEGPDSVLIELPDETPVEALRYAWADNPVCNLFSLEGLPATPFRTDR